YRMIEYIRAYEKTKPKQHPIGMTVGFPGPGNRALLESPADWISPNFRAADGYDYRKNPPPADGTKVVLSDTDHLWGNRCKDHTWAWRSFCRGHNLLYMDKWTWEQDDLDRERVRKALGHVRRFAERMDLRATRPANALASSEYCLANPGRQYLVYIPSGRAVTLDLSGVSGTFDVEWFNPRTGDTEDGGTVAGGAERAFGCPFEGDAVLYVFRR
ncbi:MAG: putative collagen-binding domain-containing protein, partial [Armatimonadota bacterium]